MSSTFNLADDKQWLWIVNGGAERLFRSDPDAARVMAFTVLNLGPGSIEVRELPGGDITVLPANEVWSKVARTVGVKESAGATAFGRVVAIDLRAAS